MKKLPVYVLLTLIGLAIVAILVATYPQAQTPSAIYPYDLVLNSEPPVGNVTIDDLDTTINVTTCDIANYNPSTDRTTTVFVAYKDGVADIYYDNSYLPQEYNEVRCWKVMDSFPDQAKIDQLVNKMASEASGIAAPVIKIFRSTTNLSQPHPPLAPLRHHSKH